MMELHRRMAHIDPGVARKLLENELAIGLQLDDTATEIIWCEPCVYGKATRKPISKVRQSERAAETGGEVHTDVWGPSPVTSLGGHRYFTTFTDDKNRDTDIQFMKNKFKCFGCYKTYEAEREPHGSGRREPAST